jgi:hypothetical protein
MSSSIEFLVEQAKSAERILYDRTTFGQGRALSVHLLVVGEKQVRRWLLQSKGPYAMRLMDPANIPLLLAAPCDPLRADLDEPLEAVDVDPCPQKKIHGVLGALYVAHRKWAEGRPLPFGTFLETPERIVPGGGTLVSGPRSFVCAMRAALMRFEVPFRSRVVRSGLDPFYAKTTVLRLGHANYVRARDMIAEEVALDHGE